RAIGVEAVAAEAGISKRTLYNHFASKDALIEAYLARRSVPLPSPADDPLAEILASFDRLEETFRRGDFRGCPFVNAVAEIGDRRHGAARLAVAFKADREAWMRRRLTALGVADPDGLAVQIRLLVEGAIATMLVRGDPLVAGAAREAARTLLAAAGLAVPTAAPARGRRLPPPRRRPAAP
ncbi:MAG: TetR/AcrR family transcriptional regulator, partial [Alphaproteobacteria bacterium]